jgi:hypothetical protein
VRKRTQDMLEHKLTDVAGAVAPQVGAAGLEGRVLVFSFYVCQSTKFSQLFPKLKRALSAIRTGGGWPRG